MPVKNLKGQRFDEVVVVEEAGIIKNRMHWKCICDCGNTKVISGSYLLAGHTRSCGCKRNKNGRYWVRNISGNNRLEYGQSSLNSLYKSYSRNAQIKHRIFLLSAQEFKNIVTQNCHYCGDIPRNKFKNQNTYGEFIYNGIDRIDNSEGYVLNNCVPCCTICNHAKHTKTYTEFIEYLRRVHGHFISHFMYTDNP